MKYLQKLGRSFMQVVAVMPLAALLIGIGYAIDPVEWGANNAVANFLISSGGAILDNLGIIFAVGVAFGLSKDNHGAASVAGIVAFLTLTRLVSPVFASQVTGIVVAEKSFEELAFKSVGNGNVFFGILAGIIGGHKYNAFHNVQLPQFLAFFSGRRLVPIISSIISILLGLVLVFAWPVVYSGLAAFGKTLTQMGPLGAGLFGFFNRLLIPTGLHHALNQIFWFGIVDINDIPNFLSGKVELIQGAYHPGMYQAGYFPIMMFGLPAAALAMITEAKPERRKATSSMLLAGAFATIATGVTEPIEFAFMFAAPGLYLVHAILTGISMFISSALGWYAGFGFSAGAIDMALSSQNKLATNWYMLILQGLVFAIIYFVLFKTMIKAFNIKTPGREDDEVVTQDSKSKFNSSNKELAEKLLVALGGASNIESHTYCTTRLRLTVLDDTKVNEAAIKKTGVPGVVKPGKNAIQVIVGPHVESVHNEFERLL